MEAQEDVLDDLLYEWRRFRESRQRLEKLIERATRLGAGENGIVKEIKLELESAKKK